MKTKTGQLLMRKLQNRPSSPASIVQQHLLIEADVAIEQPHLPKWQGSHISHVNEYNFVNIINKRVDGAPCKQDLKYLEIQNLRLIQQNMRLTEWTHGLLNKLRQGTMRAIQAIEQFRYLQGVNLLYTFLADMTEYDDNEFKLPRRPEFINQTQLLKRLAQPLSKHSFSLHFSKLQICSSVHRVKLYPSNKIQQDSSFMFNRQPNHLPAKIDEQNQKGLLRLLMTQAIAVESCLTRYSECEYS